MRVSTVANLTGAVTAAVFLVACSGAQKVSSIKVNVAEIEKKYASSVSTSFEGDKKYTVCPTRKSIEDDKSWKSLMEKANGCINKAQWSMVEAIGERISEVEPDAPWGSYYMSVASENLGHTERAMWMIDLSLKKATNVGVLRYQRGRILWKQQFYKEAIAEMEKAIRLDKNIKDAYVFLGEVYLRELDFNKSSKYFQSALLIEPRNKEALFGLASCHIELEQATEAVSVIERGISNYPRSLEFRLQEVYVYENLLKNADVALSKYKNLRTLMSNKRVEGTLPFDIGEKIKVLEEVSQRTLASKPSEQKKK